MEYQTSEPAMGLVGSVRLIDQPSPLQGALNEHGEQLDKLRGLLEQLTGRLQSVSNPRPTADEVGINEPAVSSQLTGQVKMQTVSVKSMQALISRVLDELEV